MYFDFRCLRSKTIIERTHVRPTTVSKVVSELIDDGLIYEDSRSGKKSKGRPERSLHPHYNRLVTISLCVQSHHIRGVLINLGEEILVERTIYIGEEATNNVFLHSLSSFINKLKVEIPSESELLGVGISVPGSINRQTQTWIYTSRWSNLANLSFHDIAENTGLKIHPTHFLNANLEYLMMTKPEYKQGGTILYHWGYGIGVSYALDGRVIKSTLGSFAEVGHWQVARDMNAQCPCGAKGCLETEAALWSLLQKIEIDGKDIPNDESELGDFLIDNNLFQHPKFLEARDRIEDSLVNLYQTFYPERILIYGPFLSDSRYFQRLSRNLTGRITSLYRDSVRLEEIIPSSNSIPVGSTIKLFMNRLDSLLTARW